MTYKIYEDQLSGMLTPMEVAEQLTWCGELNLDDGERIVSATLQCGHDLEIIISDGENEYTREFTESDLREIFDEVDFVVWSEDEHGNNILLCF